MLYAGPQGGGAAGLVPMGGNVAAGGVGSGYAYEEPDLVEADANYTATTADQLDVALDTATPENPVIIWVPPDAAINYSGRDREITQRGREHEIRRPPRRYHLLEQHGVEFDELPRRVRRLVLEVGEEIEDVLDLGLRVARVSVEARLVAQK